MTSAPVQDPSALCHLDKPGLLVGSHMQILFGHLVGKKKKKGDNPVACYWAILKKIKKLKNMVFEDTIILLGLYETRTCPLSKTISLFPYRVYLTTEDLTAALVEKPCWYF